MRRRPRRFRSTYVVAATLAFVVFGGATVGSAFSNDGDDFGLRFGAPEEPAPSSGTRLARPQPTITEPDDHGDGGGTSTGTYVLPTVPRTPAVAPKIPIGPSVGQSSIPDDPGGTSTGSGSCRTGWKLIPTCGVLWGVAPGAFTDKRGARALQDFEAKTGRHQDIYHAYHKGTNQVFPTKEEIAIARDSGEERILFLNWKPSGASWAEIAKGDAKTDAFLDRLAEHLKKNFTEDFFFTVHHEAEDNVREKAGSGWTAQDYSAMFRYVIKRLRAHGADNIVSVVVHMAYVPHTSKAWFESMYPGNDVVDWIGFDTYAYSDPGYGHGDFSELLNRTASNRPTWPGFYNWAATRHPNKPLMVAEWGVWSSKKNPAHKAEFYREVGEQIKKFPKIKAMVHFDTPHNQDGRDSRVDATSESLAAYRRLGNLPVFQVEVANRS
jgi:hypothetical protein